MPSLASVRENRPERRRNRSGRVSRTSSVLGTLKNIVYSPLTWFGSAERLASQSVSSDDFEDTPGVNGTPAKRRRVVTAPLNGDREGSGRASKRKRYEEHPPPPQQVQEQAQTQQQQHQISHGYLDIPDRVVPPPPPAPRNLQPAQDRSSSIAIPPNFSQTQHTRHTDSPHASASYAAPSAIARTQSMDPPAMLNATRGSLRDVSMGSIPSGLPRDLTSSPTCAPFHVRMRTSLTPQPSGQRFGPMPSRRDRDASEPPPLAALMTNPVFVKTPQSVQQQQPQQPTLTLGSLGSHRGAGLGPYSPLFLGSEVASSAYYRPINAAEKALHDLDVYKTPLLPSRLRGSPKIPDMFRPKRFSVPTLLHKEKDNKPRLGMVDTGKGNEDLSSVSPYAGRGGLKKLLAKRRLEEEEEEEKERENAMEEDEDDSLQYEEPELAVPETLPPPVLLPAVPASPVPGRTQSSLRVGRTTTSRNHIQRPTRPVATSATTTSTRTTGRYSAKFNEDELDIQMTTEATEEANVRKEVRKATEAEQTKEVQGRKEAQKIVLPPGFSFVNDKAPITHDATDAKEPPLTALPFSFADWAASKGIPVPTEAPKQPVSVFAKLASAPATALPTVAAESTPETLTVAPTTPALSTMPSFSLTPPTPAPPVPAPAPSAPSTSAQPARTEGSSIPNFFTNSALLKAGANVTQAVTVPPSPMFSSELAARPAVSALGEAKAAEPTAPTPTEQPKSTPTSLFGRPAPAAKEAPVQPSTSLFGSVPSAISATPDTLSGAPQKPAEEPKSLAPAFNFAAPSQAAEVSKPSGSVFSFATPPKPAEVPKHSTPSFGFPKPAETSAPSPFSFATTSKPAEAPATPAAPAQPSFFATPAKPAESSAPPSFPFTFGAPKAEQAKAPEAKAEPLKPSLFGNAPAAPSPFAGFGGAAASSPAAEQPKSAFSFTPSAPAVAAEQPKSFFDAAPSAGSAFGQPAASAPSDGTNAKSPFSFGASPSSTPAAKLAYTFGAPPSGGHGTDVSSKPFVFGSSTTSARPTTPPHTHDSEVMMDESPTRGSSMDMNGSAKPEIAKVQTGFTFGQSGTSGVSPFGQPNQNNSSSFNFASNPNPFGAKPEAKPEIKTTFAGFGQQAGSSGFTFGHKESTQSPLSPSPFPPSPFNQAPAQSAAAAFPFGGPSPGGAFGQRPSTAPSNPASPSTFNPPNAFNFAPSPTSAGAPANQFRFGSQPASPAAANPGLPQQQSAAPVQFHFAQTPVPSPSSPFPENPAQQPAIPGEVMFVMGSAPPPVPKENRPMRRLPNRRNAKR